MVASRRAVQRVAGAPAPTDVGAGADVLVWSPRRVAGGSLTRLADRSRGRLLVPCLIAFGSGFLLPVSIARQQERSIPKPRLATER